MSRPLRVLIVIKGFGPGGAERLVLDQLQRTGAHGIDYELFVCAGREPNLLTEAQATGVTVHLGYEGGHPWPLKLRRTIQAGDFDVVHSHLPIAATGVRLVSRTSRRRPALVYTEHNRWPSYLFPTRLANRATSWLDDVTFAVSDDAAASMRFPFRGQAQVLDHGVSASMPVPSERLRAKLRDELAIAPNSVVVGTIANLRREKAQDELIRAFSALGPAEAHLAIVGQGPLEHELRACADESGVADRVHFLGYRSDAPYVAAGFDVFTLPSAHEGRPVALMEAMAIGLPIVVTDVGAMPTMVEHDVSALIVPTNDRAALAHALGSLASDESTRARLAEAARTRATTFDPSGAFSIIEDTYRALSGVR